MEQRSIRQPVSDLAPRLRQLEAMLQQQPRNIRDIARLMRISEPTAKMYLSRLRKSRDVICHLDYGNSTYEITSQNHADTK